MKNKITLPRHLIRRQRLMIGRQGPGRGSLRSLACGWHGTRFGLGLATTETIEWLIRNHGDVDVAAKRDIADLRWGLPRR